MGNPETWVCQNCGNTGLEDGDDGFFYCTHCNSQAEGFMDTGVGDEDFIDQTGNPYGGLYSARHTRRIHNPVVKPEPLSQPLEDFSPYCEPVSQTGAKLEDQDIEEDDYYGWIRLRYVMGLQRMVELQCEALVMEFQVTPLVCGLAGTIWLRFLAATQVLNDDCADQIIDFNQQGELRRSLAPNNAKFDLQAIMAWFKSLKKSIPLSYTLAVSFLACHLAREAILPTDMVKWTLEGKLPYFAAFNEIEDDMEQFGQRLRACPISSSKMFRPSESVPVQKLESLAASVAGLIGLDLPPVNFYAISSRFLNKLALPLERILPHVCRIYEWSMPPELWLSTNELRLPTRVCVMSILIVAIRIIYNIHGFGEWERSLLRRHDSDDAANDSDDAANDSDASQSKKYQTNFDDSSKLDTTELLANLEARYNEISDDYEYCKDLPTYLQFCKDIVFARSESSYKDAKEEKLIETLWSFYQIGKDSIAVAEQGLDCDRIDDQERLRCNEELATETLKNEAINQMKLDMEEKRFCYIPPRKNIKRLDYLHYVRKQDDGAYTYVAHADYYILLRACARVAQVETRCMHIGVLGFERRLAWLEKRIDHCLRLTPPIISCEYCTDRVPEETTDAEITIEESIGLSDLNI